MGGASTKPKPKPTTAEGWSKQVDGADKVKIPAKDWETIQILPCTAPQSMYSNAETSNVFTVQSFFPVVPYLMAIPCTMTIFRDSNGDVTLFNAFRVPPEVEDAILEIGPVKHVVKLGGFHGAADAYYLRAPKFGSPKFWAVEGMRYADGLETPNMLESESLPIKGAKLVTLDSPFPECVMTVPGMKDDNVLIVSDTLVHVSHTRGMPLFGRAVFNWFGLATEGVPNFAPIWSRIQFDAIGRDGLKPYYNRMMEMAWDSVITAHGNAIVNSDRDKIKAFIDKALAG